MSESRERKRCHLFCLGWRILIATHNDDEADKLCVSSLPTLSGYDIPLLWGADNHLSLSYLFLTQLVVSSQFIHSNLVGTQPLSNQCSMASRLIHNVTGFS